MCSGFHSVLIEFSVKIKHLFFVYQNLSLSVTRTYHTYIHKYTHIYIFSVIFLVAELHESTPPAAHRPAFLFSSEHEHTHTHTHAHSHAHSSRSDPTHLRAVNPQLAHTHVQVSGLPIVHERPAHTSSGAIATSDIVRAHTLGFEENKSDVDAYTSSDIDTNTHIHMCGGAAESSNVEHAHRHGHVHELGHVTQTHTFTDAVHTMSGGDEASSGVSMCQVDIGVDSMASDAVAVTVAPANVSQPDQSQTQSQVSQVSPTDTMMHAYFVSKSGDSTASPLSPSSPHSPSLFSTHTLTSASPPGASACTLAQAQQQVSASAHVLLSGGAINSAGQLSSHATVSRRSADLEPPNCTLASTPTPITPHIQQPNLHTNTKTDVHPMSTSSPGLSDVDTSATPSTHSSSHQSGDCHPSNCHNSNMNSNCNSDSGHSQSPSQPQPAHAPLVLRLASRNNLQASALTLLNLRTRDIDSGNNFNRNANPLLQLKQLQDDVMLASSSLSPSSPLPLPTDFLPSNSSRTHTHIRTHTRATSLSSSSQPTTAPTHTHTLGRNISCPVLQPSSPAYSTTSVGSGGATPVSTNSSGCDSPVSDPKTGRPFRVLLAEDSEPTRKL